MIADALPLTHLIDGLSAAIVGSTGDVRRVRGGARRVDHRRAGARGALLSLGVGLG